MPPRRKEKNVYHPTPKTNRKAPKGRPGKQFPPAFRPAVVQMAKDGRGVEEARELLIAGGYNVDRAVIKEIMDAGLAEAFEPTAAGPLGQQAPATVTPDGQGLDCARFTDDVRAIVDDMVLDGREPVRIRAYLASEGIDAPLEDVERFVSSRLATLSEDAKSSLSAETRQLAAHVRSLRLKAAHIWAKLPPSEKYTGKLYAQIAAELTRAQSLLLDTLRANDEGGGRDDSDLLDEMERRLGLDAQAPESPAPEASEGPST